MSPPAEVLCVSDDGGFVDSLESSFDSRSEDTTIRHVKSGFAAYVELLDAASVIHCVVLAVPLADGDEAEFTRNIREHGLDVPVVVATDDERVAKRVLDAGATDYVVYDDPETLSRVATRVQRALSEYRFRQSHRDRLEQQEREAAAEQYVRMVDAVADAVYAIDADGRFTAIIPAFERLTGLTREQVIGSPASHIVGTHDPTDGGDGDDPTDSSDNAFVATSTQIVEFELETPDNGVVRVENHRTPLVVDGEKVGSVGVLRDVTQRHRYEQLLATLHERTREMMSATNREAVLDAAVETCDEVLGDARTELFVFDEDRTALTRVGEEGSGLGEKPPSSGISDGGVWEAFVTGEVRVVEVILGGDVVDGAEQVIAAPLGRHGVLVTGHPGTVAPNEVDVELVNLLSATVEELLERIDAETELRERDKRLARQNKALTKLNRINTTIRNVIQSLIRAPTRGEALSAVSEHLADAAPYSVVWHAEASEVDDEFRPPPDTVHGADAAYIDRLGEVATNAPLFGLLTDAIETGEIQTVDDVLDDLAWADHRGDALAYGFRSIAVIPAVADDRVEALFVVHANEQETIANEDGLLTELGETVGYAITATNRADAMLTERQTQLQVQLGGDRLSLTRLAQRVGHEVNLTGVIPQSDGSVIAFIVTDAAPDDVADAGRDVATRVRQLSTDGSEHLFELRLPRESLFETLYASEATLCALHASGTQTTLTVEVPERIRVRSFVDALDTNYPGTSLLSRRTCTEGATSPATFVSEIRDAWTDRQYESIRAAHLAGFYEWPRRSTAETLAETFDISAPTFQYHLRAAERKLVEHVFE